MKLTQFILLNSAILLSTVYAKDNVFGTPDGDDANTDGDLVAGSSYTFTVDETNQDPGIQGDFTLFSSLEGESWVGDKDKTPWNEFVDDTNIGTQPSFHITDDVKSGDVVIVGLSFEHVISGFTASFRMPNDIVGTNAELYFGLRYSADPDIGTTTELNLWDSTGNNLSDYGNIDKYEGITAGNDKKVGVFESPSVNSEPLPTGISGDFIDEFQWIHYTNTGDSAGSIIFDVKAQALDTPMTDWVVYLVLGDLLGNNADLADGDGADGVIEGVSLGEDPITINNGEVDADELGLVFTWTTAHKGDTRYIYDDPNNLTSGTRATNPDYDPETGGVFDFLFDVEVEVIPEPSSVSLLLLGALALVMRRKRS